MTRPPQLFGVLRVFSSQHITRKIRPFVQQKVAALYTKDLRIQGQMPCCPASKCDRNLEISISLLESRGLSK